MRGNESQRLETPPDVTDGPCHPPAMTFLLDHTHIHTLLFVHKKLHSRKPIELPKCGDLLEF